MILPAIPSNEDERLNELKEYSILDTFEEQEYDDITQIASHICETPISLITLIDEKRQWFKSHHGMPQSETAKEYAFCAHAINDKDNIFEIPDSRNDVRFFDNPFVTGDAKVIFYAGVPLVNQNGFALGTLCVIDNVPRELTALQQKSLRGLANQVVVLLELRRSKKALEKTINTLKLKNKDLEKFASIAAHDLKSPLNNITGMIELLNVFHSADLNTEAVEYLGMIDDSAANLRRLVDGILEHSRSESLLEAKKEVYNSEALFCNVVKLIDSQNQYTFVFPENNETLVINKTALDQILINLITNAIKYNNKTQIVIEFGVSQNSKFYEFSVKDNGIGIKEEYFDRIFNIFEVVQNKDRFGKRGNGIGLSTVKKLITELGGEIKVESVLGEYTKFIFTILK